MCGTTIACLEGILYPRVPIMRSVRLGELAVIVLVAAVCLCYAISSRAGAADLEFEGTPVLKVEVSNGMVQTHRCQSSVPASTASGLNEMRPGYVWASRNHVPLVKVESGAYVTYVATTGQLSKLDARAVIDDLIRLAGGHEPVLLCHERRCDCESGAR